MLFAPIAERLNAIPRPASADNPQPGSRRMRRLPAIDAARGTAMVLVCLSHFTAKYIAPAGGEGPWMWLRVVAHIASPMFFIISGTMVGYLFAARPDAFDRVRATLARRALFFLTVGHLLILIAHVRTRADLTGSARMLFVTDTIALALLVSPRLLHFSARQRLIGAAAVYTASCALVYLWDPHGLALRIFKDTMIGPEGEGFWSYNVPVLPWLAVHAAGTVLGARLAEASSTSGRLRFEAQLASLGFGLVAAGVVLRTLGLSLVSHIMTPGARDALVARQLASPWQRFPPSPVHLMVFTGLALLGISAVFIVERLGIFTRLIAWLAVLGETSAFVFVLQFYVFYEFVPRLIPLRLELSPIVFIGAMLTIGVAARLWRAQRSRFTRPSWFVTPPAAIPAPKA